MNIESVVLLGANGGKAKNYAIKRLLFQVKTIARIQNVIFLGHYIFEQVEKTNLNLYYNFTYKF